MAKIFTKTIQVSLLAVSFAASAQTSKTRTISATDLNYDTSVFVPSVGGTKSRGAVSIRNRQGSELFKVVADSPVEKHIIAKQIDDAKKRGENFVLRDPMERQVDKSITNFVSPQILSPIQYVDKIREELDQCRSGKSEVQTIRGGDTPSH